MSNKIAEILKKIQFETDLTQQEIAERIGYTRQYLGVALKKGNNGKILKLLEAEFAEILQNDNKPTVTNDAPNRLSAIDTAKMFAELNKKLDWLTINLEESKRVTEQNNALIQAGLFAQARSVAPPEKIDEMFQSSIDFAREILKRTQGKLLIVKKKK